MGEIVFAAAASHAPGITGDPEHADPEQASRFYAGMERLHQAFEAAQPDVVVAISNDHLYNFYLDNTPTIAIGVGESHFGPFEPESWLRIPQRTLPGHPELAKAMLREAVNSGFDLAFSEELSLGHAEMVPLHFITPGWNVPVVPIMVNDFVQPMPSPRRIYQLGQLIRRFVGSRPKGERVALLGTGGLSHWVGLPEQGRVNPELDVEFLETAAQGRCESRAEWTNEEFSRGGNGMHELRNWLGVAGAVQERKAEVTTYEPMVPWITGCGALIWQL